MTRINVGNIRHPDASTDSISLDSSARVGIGESSPNRQLVVNGGTSEGVVQITNDTSGTATANGFELIHFTSGETQLLNRENGAMRFDTNNSEAMRLDASGRLGIGTSSPGSYGNNADDLIVANTGGHAGLTIHSASNGAGSFFFADGTTGDQAYRGILKYEHSDDRFLFGTAGGTTALTIDSSQRVGINTTSPSTLLQIGDSSTGNGVPKIRIHRGSGSDYFELDCDTGAPRLHAVGGGDMKIFTSNTEHMRFRASGGFIAFNDGTSSTVDAVTTKSAGTTYAYISGVHSATGPVTGGTVSLRVWTNGDIQNTNNSYGSLSDIKLKENIVDANSQWDDLKAVQVRNYNFKEETGNPTHTQIGVIAQELELVSPGLVYESPDRETVEIPALDENGDPVLDDNGDPTFTTEERETGEVTKSVNYSVLYMKAVKALQEAMERIETLEAKVAALEGG